MRNLTFKDFKSFCADDLDRFKRIWRSNYGQRFQDHSWIVYDCVIEMHAIARRRVRLINRKRLTKRKLYFS